MKKLLLGIFTLLAINAQGQSIGEPKVFNDECEFIHNFVDEDYFYFISDNDNKVDRTISIYNDALRNVKNIVTANTAFDDNQNIETGATVYSLIEYDMVSANYDGGERSYVTQTLFNNDNKWEYARGTFICTVENKEGYERKLFKLTKAEVINEDGNVLTEIPLEAIHGKGNMDNYIYYLDEIFLEVVKMGENYYLYREVEDSSNRDLVTTTFYKIEKNNGSGVKIIKNAEFKSYPNPVRENETFTIEVGEENAAPGNFIEVCDQGGRVVYRQAITDSEVKVPTRRMKGMYIYNIVSGGKSVNTGKVFVK